MGVYEIADNLDNVTFGTQTLWEGHVEEGNTFRFHPNRAPGRQYIAEAGDLAVISDAKYDFLISSHMLEHSANPIRVLNEWKRVLKPGGVLLLVLPHRDGSFDQFRPVTSLAHRIEDAERNVDERDSTHLEEILQLHDLARDPGHTTREELRVWIGDNFRNRGAHHHVYDTLSTATLLDFLRWQILDIELLRPHNICVLAQKLEPNRQTDNLEFLRPGARHFRKSPFLGDRSVSRSTPSA